MTKFTTLRTHPHDCPKENIQNNHVIDKAFVSVLYLSWWCSMHCILGLKSPTTMQCAKEMFEKSPTT